MIDQSVPVVFFLLYNCCGVLIMHCFGYAVVYVKDINEPSLQTPFYSVLVSISVFMVLSTVLHAEYHNEQIEARGEEDHRRRTGRLQSKEYHRPDLQPTHPM